MTPSNKPNKISEEPNHERDVALAAFSEQCPNPTPSQIAEWQRQYPQFAEEISDLAYGLQLLASALEKRPIREPTAEEMEREHKKALQLLHEFEDRRQIK